METAPKEVISERDLVFPAIHVNDCRTIFCWRNTNSYECCHQSTRCLHPLVVQLHVSSLTEPCFAMYVSVNNGGDSEEHHQSKVSVLICCGPQRGESSLRPSTVTRVPSAAHTFSSIPTVFVPGNPVDSIRYHQSANSLIHRPRARA